MRGTRVGDCLRFRGEEVVGFKICLIFSRYYDVCSCTMKNTKFTVYIEQDEDGIFVGSVPLIPSCYAHGDTKEEMLKNLTEVLKLCLRNRDTSFLQKAHFVETHNLDISYA